MGQDHALDLIGVLPEVREVGQHQVDPGHVDVREHDPAVDDEDPALDLEAEAVAPDLAQATEEDDPDLIWGCGRHRAEDYSAPPPGTRGRRRSGGGFAILGHLV